LASILRAFGARFRLFVQSQPFANCLHRSEVTHQRHKSEDEPVSPSRGERPNNEREYPVFREGTSAPTARDRPRK